MPPSKSNEKIVMDLFDAWRAKDPDQIASFFTEDAEYHNIPLQRVEGREAIRATCAGWLKQMDAIDFRFKHVVSDGDLVLMERCDVMGDHELPIMGIFQLRDGKICAWREYFDLAQMNAMGS